MCGEHVLKHASNVQSTFAKPTGESEYARVKGGSVGLGLQALFEDFQIPISVIVESDATAAKGTINRIGLGKARHTQTRYLGPP